MENNPFSLKGKTILVTGASSGIGRATAIECARLGAKLIVTARNESKLQETLSLMEGDGHTYVVADLANTLNIESLVDWLPDLNGVVNNAGMGLLQLVPFIKEEAVDKIFDVNLKAPILLTHRIVKKKKICNGGSIVFTSSIAGMGFSSPGNSLYSSTKGGMSAFMRNAALELASKRIRCNAVCPGMVETPLKDGKSTITEEQWEINKQLYPLKRFGLPEDVAYSIAFLLSDASAWITGIELVVDGGRSLR